MSITPEQLKEIIREAVKPMVVRSEIKLTMTIDEAAEVSGIGRDKLRELVNNQNRNDFPCFTVGKKTLINRDKFLAWLDKISEERRAI